MISLFLNNYLNYILFNFITFILGFDPWIESSLLFDCN